MGMFDTVHTGDRCIQVKCFGAVLADRRVGDEVVFELYDAFGIEQGGVAPGTTEFQVDGHGCWVVVRDGRIDGVVDAPTDGLVRVDTFGRAWDPSIPQRGASSPAGSCSVCALIRGEEPDVDVAGPDDDVDLVTWLGSNAQL